MYPLYNGQGADSGWMSTPVEFYGQLHARLAEIPQWNAERPSSGAQSRLAGAASLWSVVLGVAINSAFLIVILEGGAPASPREQGIPALSSD